MSYRRGLDHLSEGITWFQETSECIYWKTSNLHGYLIRNNKCSNGKGNSNLKYPWVMNPQQLLRHLTEELLMLEDRFIREIRVKIHVGKLSIQISLHNYSPSITLFFPLFSHPFYLQTCSFFSKREHKDHIHSTNIYQLNFDEYI